MSLCHFKLTCTKLFTRHLKPSSTRLPLISLYYNLAMNYSVHVVTRHTNVSRHMLTTRHILNLGSLGNKWLFSVFGIHYPNPLPCSACTRCSVSLVARSQWWPTNIPNEWLSVWSINYVNTTRDQQSPPLTFSDKNTSSKTSKCLNTHTWIIMPNSAQLGYYTEIPK
jgi:hypothetical protein